MIFFNPSILTNEYMMRVGGVKSDSAILTEAEYCEAVRQRVYDLIANSIAEEGREATIYYISNFVGYEVYPMPTNDLTEIVMRSNAMSAFVSETSQNWVHVSPQASIEFFERMKNPMLSDTAFYEGISPMQAQKAMQSYYNENSDLSTFLLALEAYADYDEDDGVYDEDDDEDDSE